MHIIEESYVPKQEFGNEEIKMTGVWERGNKNDWSLGTRS